MKPNLLFESLSLVFNPYCWDLPKLFLLHCLGIDLSEGEGLIKTWIQVLWDHLSLEPVLQENDIR